MFAPPATWFLGGLVIDISAEVSVGAPVEKLWLGCNTGILSSAPLVKFVLIGWLEPFRKSKTLGVAGRDDGVIVNGLIPLRGICDLGGEEDGVLPPVWLSVTPTKYVLCRVFRLTCSVSRRLTTRS